MAIKQQNSEPKPSASAEQPPLPQKDGIPDLELTTFREWGQRLPVGLLRGGQLHRDFKFRRWTFEQERKLEGLRKQQDPKGRERPLTLVEFTGAVLAEMLVAFGPYGDFGELDSEERLLILSQAWTADLLYAWLSLRCEALGETLKIPVACPAGMCGNEWTITADLLETDVRVVKTPDELTYRYKLRDGIELGKKTEHDLVIQAPRWYSMSAVVPSGQVNIGEVKFRIASSAVRMAGNVEGVPEAALNTMTKWDIERFTRSVDDNSPGPELVLEASCPRCRTRLREALDWSWDFLFSAASLSPRPTS
jgi:hypothetical protein